MELKAERLSRALSASSRRTILQLLSEKEMTVKEIANITKMSVSLASRHLKLLYDLNFLTVRKAHPYKFYSLKVKEVKELLKIYSQNKESSPEHEERLSRAISAESRRKILQLLSEKERTVKEIAKTTQMSVSLASRHLKLLYDLNFLNVRKSHPYKFYSLKTKQLQQILICYNQISQQDES